MKIAKRKRSKKKRFVSRQVPSIEREENPYHRAMLSHMETELEKKKASGEIEELEKELGEEEDLGFSLFPFRIPSPYAGKLVQIIAHFRGTCPKCFIEESKKRMGEIFLYKEVNWYSFVCVRCGVYWSQLPEEEPDGEAGEQE